MFIIFKISYSVIGLIRNFIILLPWRNNPPVGQDFPIMEDWRSYSGTPESVGFLWTSDQPVAEISTWKQTTFTRSKSMTRRDSKPLPQEGSGHGDWLRKRREFKTKKKCLTPVNCMRRAVGMFSSVQEIWKCKKCAKEIKVNCKSVHSWREANTSN